MNTELKDSDPEVKTHRCDEKGAVSFSEIDEPGRSRREWFAGLAMQSLILSSNPAALLKQAKERKTHIPHILAQAAYEYADAMLAEGEPKQPKQFYDVQYRKTDAAGMATGELLHRHVLAKNGVEALQLVATAERPCQTIMANPVKLETEKIGKF